MGRRESTAMVSSAAAIGSVLAAMTCCLPLGVVFAAAGLAGASALLSKYSAYLMGLSVVLLGYAFYASYTSKQCDRRQAKWSRAVTWFAAAMLVGFFVFPQWAASLLADVLPAGAR